MKRQPPPPSGAGFTPLIDIAFLLLIFFLSLPFRRLDGKLKANLPAEGPERWEAPERVVVRLSVTGEGDAAVYRLGDRATRDPRALEPVLRDLGPERTYQIHASPRVAWKCVVRLADLLAALDLPKVQFAGGGPRPRGR